MKILLSIKPEFAELIFTGKKKYEFRRIIFKERGVKTILVYASSPVQKVIGEFEIEEILKADIQSLWNKTKEHAGIDESYFYSYFNNKTEGFAIKIANVKRYKEALNITEKFRVSPPQSFLYLK